ncbi:hypothetical protein GCM10022225_18530 [Plantactinospora mayteni]|uniref:Flavin reductase n=1 Tax=Plantactinospora mayteni TaxID=566021 RepID=A0ABQ4EN15_9ACTN|nr:hypothetical protein Pma05_26110 [Plantactinospora mayteni]
MPIRPIWLCRSCGAPWPCGPARLSLIDEFRNEPSGLSVHLAGALFEAIKDLYNLNFPPGPDMVALFMRFVGWATRAKP